MIHVFSQTYWFFIITFNLLCKKYTFYRRADIFSIGRIFSKIYILQFVFHFTILIFFCFCLRWLVTLPPFRISAPSGSQSSNVKFPWLDWVSAHLFVYYFQDFYYEFVKQFGFDFKYVIFTDLNNCLQVWYLILYIILGLKFKFKQPLTSICLLLLCLI